jgi:ADP-heptose:LPS heptosyltransferase
MKVLVVAPSWIGDTIMMQHGGAVWLFGSPKDHAVAGDIVRQTPGQVLAACLKWISP